MKLQYSTVLTLVATVLLSAEVVGSVGVGYNSECRLDSECREAKPDVQDVCCAKLIYEANGGSISSRSCESKAAIETANGSFDFQGAKTTEAFCDDALMGMVFNSMAVVAGSVAMLAVL